MEYIPLTNVAPNPEDAFDVDQNELAGALAGRFLEGIHHSHPFSDIQTGKGFCPSHADMACQLEWAVPFYVTVLGKSAGYRDFFAWGDQLPVPPLRSRQFRHGVTDCFALCRDVMSVAFDTYVPDFPRSMEWWDDPDAENPIEAYFDRSGWQEVPMAEIQPGDGVLMAFRNDVIVHCAVYADNDLIAHHLHGRLSVVDPLPQWRRFLRKVVRFSAPGAETRNGA